MVSVDKINAYLNTLPGRIAAAPLDEKIAYFAVIAGILLVVIGIVVKIIF